MARALSGLCVVLLVTSTVVAQVAPADPSPHQTGTVAVAGVRVPYLDWGGDGPPLVFIAGFGNSAHVFDSFAPRFTDRFHAIGVTRVGFGEADQPTSVGYDLTTRVEHIRLALDTLKLGKAVLVGHSLGGDEITAFAARYPARVAGLIYLDAGLDHRAPIRWLNDATEIVAPVEPRPSAADLQNVLTYQKWYGRMIGVELPLGEMLAITAFDPSGAVRGNRASPDVYARTVEATVEPPFAEVRVPVLALYADQVAADVFPWLPAYPAQHAAVTALLERVEPEVQAERAKFVRAIPRAQVHTYPAHHYLFLTLPDDTERRMRAFLSEVNP